MCRQPLSLEARWPESGRARGLAEDFLPQRLTALGGEYDLTQRGANPSCPRTAAQTRAQDRRPTEQCGALRGEPA
eukprot:3930358-Prymnesium_polylepis.1